MNNKFKKNIFFIIITILFVNCVSLVEKTGRFLDGSSRENKEIAFYRASFESYETELEISIVENKSEEKSILISIKKYPFFKIRATYPDSNNTIYLIALEFLAGSSQGWNEFSLALLGEGSFSITDTHLFVLKEQIEPVHITHGRIQRRDTRLTGDEALTALRNRRERILALTEWMLSQEAPDFPDTNAFSDFWQPVLFPEIAARSKRPDNWQESTDNFQRGEDIRWNLGYTERIFPEILQPVRNSGTLLRDWEEALPWIFIEYEWKNIIELLTKEKQLNKAR